MWARFARTGACEFALGSVKVAQAKGRIQTLLLLGDGAGVERVGGDDVLSGLFGCRVGLVLVGVRVHDVVVVIDLVLGDQGRLVGVENFAADPALAGNCRVRRLEIVESHETFFDEVEEQA
eukprot:5060571-Prymnesium_polylepis.1